MLSDRTSSDAAFSINCCEAQAKDFPSEPCWNQQEECMGRTGLWAQCFQNWHGEIMMPYIFCPLLLPWLRGVSSWRQREADRSSYQGQTSVAHCDRSCWLLTSWFVQNHVQTDIEHMFLKHYASFHKVGQVMVCYFPSSQGDDRDKMVRWPHQLNGHECDKLWEMEKDRRSLESCSPWGCKVLGTTDNWTTTATASQKALQAQWDTSSNWFLSSVSLLGAYA